MFDCCDCLILFPLVYYYEVFVSPVQSSPVQSTSVQLVTPISNKVAQTWFVVVSNHWAGLMDWIAGLTFELNLFVSPDLQPIRRVERSHGLPRKYTGLYTLSAVTIMVTLHNIQYFKKTNTHWWSFPLFWSGYSCLRVGEAIWPVYA